MTRQLSPARLGGTAIAAVLVLSATPLFAQTADPASTAAPIVSAPAPVIAAPAPQPTATALVQAISAPAPLAMQSQPVYHVADADPAAADAADTASRVVRNKPTLAKSVAGPVTPRAPAPEAVPAAKIASAAALPASAEAPAAPAPLAPAPATFDRANPVPQPQQRLSTTDDAEIAGGAALLLVLAGGAFALAGRRRGRVDAGDVIVAEPMTAEPAAATPVSQEFAEPQPALVEPRIAPVAASAPRAAATLPNGFDLSRFGAHVQAAYRGPTPDNPSLSLKTRLHRAAALDQRERMAAEEGVAPLPATAGLPEQAVARAEADEQLVYRPAGVRAKRLFRPAWQK